MFTAGSEQDSGNIVWYLCEVLSGIELFFQFFRDGFVGSLVWSLPIGVTSWGMKRNFLPFAKRILRFHVHPTRRCPVYVALSLCPPEQVSKDTHRNVLIFRAWPTQGHAAGTSPAIRTSQSALPCPQPLFLGPEDMEARFKKLNWELTDRELEGW